jgi:hypothetical protein
MSSCGSSIYRSVACFGTGNSTDRIFLAVIRREADLIAPNSLLTQIIRDASHSSDALREAMSTSITDSPPQPPVSTPEINVASPTSPIQRFLSMTKPSKGKGPWKDPEVCNSILQRLL